MNQIEEGTEVVNIDARSRAKSRYMDQVMADLNIGDNDSQDDDLLDLMDRA